MAWLGKFPFFVILLAIAGLAMLPIAIVAVQLSEFATARAFFYACLLVLVVTTMLALALRGLRPGNIELNHLLTLVGSFVGLPAVFALPFQQAIGDTSWTNAYFEMVSAFTTTGATVFEPERLSTPLHIWRAVVAWMGGLFIWITAAAIFAPLNLGGFEVSATSEPGRGLGGSSLTPELETPQRLLKVSRQLISIYVGLTAVLWTCLIIAGDIPSTAVIHAMSTLSTSGISNSDGISNAASGRPGEVLIFLFLVFALSRRAFSAEAATTATTRMIEDPEMRVGVFLVLLATGVVFAAHFFGSIDIQAEAEPARALNAAWGTLFTVLSFLTTTGFSSADWIEAQSWSGLKSPGLVLVGLVLMGGGVATTAGGVKLLRIYALYIHGRRELERLVHPSLITHTGRSSRRVRRRGVYISWVFFMLFALSIALVWAALAALGVGFEDGMVLTVSALSTTGPLAPLISDGAIGFGGIDDPAKYVLMAAMVLGRLETLAIIALLNRDLWRG